MSIVNRIIDRLDRGVLRNRPTILKLGSVPIVITRGHELRNHTKRYPKYGKNLIRLTDGVLKKYPKTAIINVGANIGDTIGFIRNTTANPILAIEGEKEFLSLLEANADILGGVTLKKVFIGDSQSITVKKPRRGTATLVSGQGETTQGLDSVVSSVEWKSSKFLVTDTDGYDAKVIYSGTAFIQSTHPVIFTEFTRTLLTEKGDSGLELLLFLERNGYTKIIIYDNVGRMLCSTDISNPIIEQLYLYSKTRTVVPFYDIALFHKEDEDIATSVTRNELSLNK